MNVHTLAMPLTPMVQFWTPCKNGQRVQQDNEELGNEHSNIKITWQPPPNKKKHAELAWSGLPGAREPRTPTPACTACIRQHKQVMQEERRGAMGMA